MSISFRFGGRTSWSQSWIVALCAGALLFPRLTAAEDVPRSLIETFAYPGAERIRQAYGMVVHDGDGHILVSECSGDPALISVETWHGEFCFKVTAATGRLGLELPDPFVIEADAHTLTSTVLVDGVPETRALRTNTWTSVGRSFHEDANEVTLVELRSLGGPTGAPSTPIAAELPFVARVDAGGTRACTGSLVDRRWVLTARSCFAGDAVAGTTVTVGRGDLRQTTGQVRTAVELLPHPERDVALLRLATPITDVSPIAIATTPAVQGEVLQVAGYGRTRDEWVPSRVHVAPFTVLDVGATTLTVEPEDGSTSTCPGDGGGPTFRRTNAGHALVAIHASSWQGGCLAEPESRTAATETRVDDVAAWVRSAVVRQGTPHAVDGDVDGDGRADLMLLHQLADEKAAVWIHRATTEGFGPPVASWESDGRGPLPTQHIELVTGDFNRDGLAEVTLIGEDASGELWLQAFAADGTGSVVPTSAGRKTGVTSGSSGRFQVSSGDVDGDGAHDLIVARERDDRTLEVSVLRARAQAAVDFEAPAIWWVSSAESVAWDQASFVVGNFDGDASGRDDLAIIRRESGRTSIRIHRSSGSAFGSVWSSSTYASGVFSAPRARFLAADLSGLGDQDEIVALHAAGPATTAVTVFSQSLGRAHPNDWIMQQWWRSSDGALDDRLSEVYAGDYDGDGLVDLALLYDRTGSVASLHRLLTKADGSGALDPDLATPAWQGSTGARPRPAAQAARHDADGDGFADIAALYNYDSGSSRFFLFRGASSGVNAPLEVWYSGVHHWDWNRTKLTSGDFDGDGYGDVAALYDYDGGNVRFFLFRGKPTGLEPPIEVWYSGPGNWDWERVMLTSGDFDGDGHDDIAALYDYDGGAVRFFLLRGQSEGLAPPIEAWYSGPGNWEWERVMLSSGDFDGDGYGDVAALYNYGGGNVRFFVFRGEPTGLEPPIEAWYSGPGNWDWERVMLTAGDFDGDGYGDIAALYNYGSLNARFFHFRGQPSGLAPPVEVWYGANSWDWQRTKLASGDFDGDGRSDIGALYNYDGGRTRLWLFPGGRADSGPSEIWDSGPGNWDWHRSKLN